MQKVLAVHRGMRQFDCRCLALQAFGPFVFYDTDSRETIPEGSSSLVNVVEVEMVLCVYAQLMSHHPHLKTQGSVAVISPYKAQVSSSTHHLGHHISRALYTVSLLAATACCSMVSPSTATQSLSAFGAKVQAT